MGQGYHYTNCVTKDIPLTLKKWMGHASIYTTAIYVDIEQNKFFEWDWDKSPILEFQVTPP